MISEIVPAFARKKLFGYKFVAYAAIGLASVTFFVWGHHMFVNGQSDLASLAFSCCPSRRRALGGQGLQLDRDDP